MERVDDSGFGLSLGIDLRFEALFFLATSVNRSIEMAVNGKRPGCQRPCKCPPDGSKCFPHGLMSEAAVSFSRQNSRGVVCNKEQGGRKAAHDLGFSKFLSAKGGLP